MYLNRETRELYLKTFRQLLRPNGILLIDFYAPRYFLYRAFIQRLPLKVRAHSASAFFYCRLRGTFITPRIFEAEANEQGFVVNRADDELYYPCRELEGHNFNTLFGAYWSA
jgi:hypothetical protein